MKSVRPKPVDWRKLSLSPEEGFVLSRVDGVLSLRELVALTGLEEGRVVEIVERLNREGAVDVEGSDPTPAPAPRAPAKQSASTQSTLAAEPHLPELEPLEDAAVEDSTAGAAEAADNAAEGDDSAAEERAANDERAYRRLYESLFAPMQRDERIAATTTAEGSELLALCFDPEPQVIHAVLTSPRATLEHARLVALHHRTHVGLEIVGRRTDFLKDSLVQRRLLANPQLPDSLLGRVVGPKLLMDVYKIAINREIPERSRVKTRELLQKKFMLGSGDERAALLIKTEGRCLILLTGCALDARTTQILCAKTTYSVLFIQNLGRWSATPPQLLTHLLKQPLVRQNMGLRKLLLKHPNVPSETKRNLT